MGKGGILLHVLCFLRAKTFLLLSFVSLLPCIDKIYLRSHPRFPCPSVASVPVGEFPAQGIFHICLPPTIVCVTQPFDGMIGRGLALLDLGEVEESELLVVHCLGAAGPGLVVR